MHKGRLEAFSDGVFAIIITIMVLEIKVPHGTDMDVLISLGPQFFSYALSFAYVAIYWNNHHHIFQATSIINGKIMWANMLLLFSLSLFPFVSGWMGENKIAPLPIAGFSFILFMCGATWGLLFKHLLALHPKDSVLHRSQNKFKVNLSMLSYALGMIVPFYNPLLGFTFTIIPALMWLMPNNKIENELLNKKNV